MITFKITGTVKVAETGVGLPGLLVKAYDKDILFDDLLGSAITGTGGGFGIVSEMKDFRDFFDVKPDIYLKVYTSDGTKEIYATKEGIRWNAGRVEDFEVLIPLKEIGNGAPPKNVQLLSENGETRTSYDPGESLVVHLRGLEANTVHDLTLSDDGGTPTTIRIPLHVFQTEVINTQKVDLTQITTVAFDFKANNSGEIEIDSLEFTN